MLVPIEDRGASQASGRAGARCGAADGLEDYNAEAYRHIAERAAALASSKHEDGEWLPTGTLTPFPG
jgi:hypothetical protein